MNFQSWTIFVEDFISAIVSSMPINAFMAYTIDQNLNISQHYYQNIAATAVDQYLNEMQRYDPLNIQQQGSLSSNLQVLSRHCVADQYATFIDQNQIGDNVELYFYCDGIPMYGLSLLRPKQSGWFNTAELAFLKSYYHLASCYFDMRASQQQSFQTLSLDQYGLTKKQQQVIQLICTGMDNQQIARDMFISISTVKTHIQHIFQKLQVSNKHQLVTRLSHR